MARIRMGGLPPAPTNVPPPPRQIDEIPLTGQESVTAENSQSQSSTPSSLTPSEISKLRGKRKRGSSTVGVNVGGNNNTISSINVNQSSTINTPIIIKGGVNHITMENLRHAIETTSRSPKEHGESSGKGNQDKESSGK